MKSTILKAIEQESFLINNLTNGVKEIHKSINTEFGTIEIEARFNVSFNSNSSFGFDQNEKVEEFRHSNAQFLVCRECVSSSICAFCHFRFEEDMLYIWEIQINNKNQGLGLGRLLMSILDLVTLSRSLRKIMLTAFIANQNAVEFYKKLGFKVDKSETPKDADYLIFYKYMSLSQRSKRRNHRKR